MTEFLFLDELSIQHGTQIRFGFLNPTIRTNCPHCHFSSDEIEPFA